MQNTNLQVATSQKVQFLSQLASYPEVSIQGTGQVETIETHMSWVFLTEQYAYKLKKPVRYDFLNFSTLAARYQNCQAELRLNRRLAPDIYLALVPLTINLRGELQLDTGDEVVDWLVKMHRLPADSMLDVAIKRKTVETRDIMRMMQRLVDFYQALPPANLSAVDYRYQLKSDLQTICQDLTAYGDGLPGDLVSHLTGELIVFLQAESQLFDSRIGQGKIIEGHGDLRPEHICLRPNIAIIDCLEFNQSLRILDCVDELAFLSLECERLGGDGIGRQLLEIYGEISEDRPPKRLIHFYKAYRACLRAKLAIWHMKEPDRLKAVDWFARARNYLHLAEKFLP